MGLVEVFGIGTNRVVTQVDKLVPDFFCIIIGCRKPYIALIIKPYGQGVETRGDDPLADVEFAAFNNQRVLYILLCNPL
jgi:hypothetical protein